MQTMIREFSKITQLKFGSTEKLRNLPNIPQLLWKDRWVRQLAYDHTVHNRKHREIRKLAYLTQLISSVHFSRSVVSDSATPWTAEHQAPLSITNSQSLLKLVSIESVMPSSHLILCHRLLLLPSIFPSVRVFNKESVLCIKSPSIRVSASVLAMNIQD